jgi:ABC-type branched-subunit amino acid transport system substrate-binding protein
MRILRRPLRFLAIVGGSIVVAALAFAAILRLYAPTPYHIAYPMPLSGPLAYLTHEALNATSLYLDEVNAAGGVNGHPVVLDAIDDRGDPEAGRAAVPGIARSQALLVLGHYLSVSSALAGPLYRDAHIPALTAFSYADEVTRGNPWYFRAQVTNSFQARWLIEYIRNVFAPAGDSGLMRASDVHLVYSDDVFGHSFLAGAQRADGGGPTLAFPFDASPRTLEASARAVAARVAQEPEPRIIVIGAAPEGLEAVIKALRRAGVRSPVFAAGGAASAAFAEHLMAQPEEKETSGFFTDNLYVGASIVFDSAGSGAQAFAEKYIHRFGAAPSYIGAQATDGVRIAVEALRRARPQGAGHVGEDREAVRAALAGMNSAATGVDGTDARLFFDDSRDMALPIRLAVFRRGRLVSAPLQLVSVDHPELVRMDEALASHDIVRIAGQYYWVQRLVFTGIDINRMGRVDVREGRFAADFFLWMRFPGNDAAPTSIEFPDAVSERLFAAARPIESGQQEGLNYRLYRIAGDFRAEFDLHDYPFDQQTLRLRLVNTQFPRQQIAYVTDVFGLHLDQSGEPLDGTSAFRDLQLWQVLDISRFIDFFSNRSTLGKPVLFDSDARTEYAEFDTAVVLKRNVVAFMVKTLIPLFLLMAVVFATLFFPPSLSKERTTIPVTGILTSAVLMISINSQLPPIGYTVSVEYVFYLFFALCLGSMVAGFVQERQRIAGNVAAARATDMVARVVYAVVVLATLAAFVWRYGGW